MRVRHVKLAIVGSILSLLFPASASALPAEQAVGFQFTFNPSLAITLSSDELVVSNLLPGNYASSNTITINVQTNNHSGYTLTAAVGDSEVPTLANSSLVNTAVNGATFTSLASNANLTLANFGSNYWGYTTTQSLSDSSLYSGLTYGTATTLNQTVDPSGKSVNGYYGGNTTDFTIGVNAGADQVSGEYTNIISFAIVPNISTDFIIESLKYLQDFTELADDELVSVINSMAAGQSYQLIDARDGEIYNLAKLADGKVWLQDNLALDLSIANSLTAADTNIAGSWNIPAEITTWANSYTDPKINTASKNTDVALGMEQSGTGKVGVYYNYCAASAGTYCMGESAGTGNAIYDICPASWRMPTGGASGEYQALYTAYSNSGADFVSALRTPLSGYYYNGSINDQNTRGYFWASTYYTNDSMHRLNVQPDWFSSNSNAYRHFGFSARCLLDPATPYTIYYDKNTTDTVSDLPSTWNGTINTVRRPTLSTATPTRSNYNFIGWCDTLPTTSGDTDTCSGTTYTPGSELPASGNSSTVYAMWKAKYTITLALAGNATSITIDGTNYTTSATLTAGTYTISGSYATDYEFDSWATSGNISLTSTSSSTTTMTVTGAGTLTLNGKESLPSLAMQNVTLATCPTTPTRVYDTRDNSIYTIQKLADNRCWLLDNLRLDLTNTTVKNNLTANTTNASATTLNYLKNGGGTTSDKYAITGVVEWTSSPNYASSYSYSDPLIATSGTGNLGDWTKDTLQSYGSGSGKIGVYYNYCAASAGSYCYGDGTSYGTSSGNATEDICPKGWRMPTGGRLAEYSALFYTAYSSDVANFKNALRTPLPGRFGNGSAANQGSNGYFWSSTYANNGAVRSLYVYSSNVDPQYSNSDRSFGTSVRCVLKASDISQVSTMQDFAINNASAIKDSMTTGQAYTLRDSRDDTRYTVSKLADGKVWLLDNLALNITNSTVKNNLFETNTNASNTTLNYLKNGGGTDSDQYAMIGVTNTWNNSQYKYSGPKIAVSGTGDNGDWTKDTMVPSMNQSISGKIGVYYNYCAATAGSYCYGDTTTGYGSPSGNATEDICPAGWRIPTGGSSGEYQALFTAYSSSLATFTSAFPTLLAGSLYNGSVSLQGTIGYFWSSTYNSNDRMYILRTGNSPYFGVYPQVDDTRFVGDSVRCVLQ